MPRQTIHIPLLNDYHTHPLLYAGFMEGVDLNRDPAEDRQQAIARIREQARNRTDGWTIAYGWNSGRYPLSKEEFDDLPPVVVLNLSLHGLIINDAGMALLRQSEPVVAKNLSNQDWIERNMRRVLNVFVGGTMTVDRLQRFFRWLLEEHGIYHAEEMLLVSAYEIQLFEEAGLAGRTRFWASPEQYDGLPPEAQAKVHGIKLFTDGALGAWTAALHKPYQRANHTGMLLYEPHELEALLARYVRAGKPLAIHAIGDSAIDQVITAIDHSRAQGQADIRIEHAQFISEATAGKAKTMGVKLCMQPNFSDDSIHYADRLPAGYPERNNPFRMLIDQAGFVPGEDLLLGSDGMPHGFREALRQSLFPPYAEQALTIEEFTAAYCQPDDTAGCIEVHMDADHQQISGWVQLHS